MSLRILVVDDHETIRAGVRSILGTRSGLEVCGEAGNGKEALEKARALKPDLVILDITMPIMDGFSVAREMHRSMPGIAILMLSMHDSPNLVNVAKSSGAWGYVGKSEGATALLRAVDAVVHQQAFFPQ